MEISTQFNKFYHSRILTDLYRKSNELIFRHLKDTRTGGAFKIIKHEDYLDMDDLKQMLKLMNLDYPLKEDGKTSTRELTTKETLQHIEFVLYVAGYNGLELDLVREDWERLLQSTR